MKEAAGRTGSYPQSESFDARLKWRRSRFKGAFLGGIAAISLIVWLVGWRTGGPNVCTDPLLKGAPQFIVLSLVVVFAAYLRQVSIGAIELRNKIVGGEIWNYPPDSDYEFVRDKVKALDRTADALSVVGPLMIWLAVFATIRIGFDAISKFVSPTTWIPCFLVRFDLGIALWLLGIFGVLGYFHFRARRDDDGIRRQAYESEPTIFERLVEKRAYQDKLARAQTAAEPAAPRSPGPRAWGSTLLLFGAVFWLASRQTKI